MTNHALQLLLLAHPFTGIQNLTDDERNTLVAAARHIESLEREAAAAKLGTV